MRITDCAGVKETTKNSQAPSLTLQATVSTLNGKMMKQKKAEQW